MTRYRETTPGNFIVDSQILHANERDKYGVTITATDGSSQWTRTFPGKVVDALRSACAEIDAKKGDWKILCISTPNTIFADLHRHQVRGQVRKPEALLLGRIGRLDLIA